jgi:hypothetical protein
MLLPLSLDDPWEDERDIVGVVAQWEQYVNVIYRDEVVKSNVVKSAPPTRQEDR